MERKNMLEAFYNAYDEDARLTKSRQGQLEYRTTMQYIRRLLPVGKKLLEVGAGTGRYSIALAKEGYDVTAWSWWSAIWRYCAAMPRDKVSSPPTRGTRRTWTS